MAKLPRLDVQGQHIVFDASRIAVAKFFPDVNEEVIRAMAAAPELLEALEAINEAFLKGEIKFTKKRQADSDPYHPANIKMHAAIAKAKIEAPR